MQKTLQIIKKIFKEAESIFENLRLQPQRIFQFRKSNLQRLIIVAHFDPDQIFDSVFLYFIKKLSSDLSASIMVVSTCESLSKGQIDKIEPYVDCLVVRRNYGRDFASWKVGIQLAKKFNTLILTNDTLYGPFSSVKPFIDRIEKEIVPTVGGLTENREITYHLQSYFLVFNSQAIESFWFKNYWKKFRAYQDRQKTIENGELGLSCSAIKAGIQLLPFIRYEDILEKAENKDWRSTKKFHNPYHFFWRELIEKFNYPFMKVELLRFNPNKIPDLDDYRELAQNMSYPVNFIIEHLERLKRLDSKK